MTRLRPHIFAGNRPSLFRPVVSLVAIYALIVSGLMPWAQAVAASSGNDTLLAALCSPNGVRYVEIDLRIDDREAPSAPDFGGLDHCPGCLNGLSAVLPVMGTLGPAPGTERFASEFHGQLWAAQSTASFQPRAPPVTG